MKNKGGAFIGVIAGIALVAALGSLILGWLAYKKPAGQDPNLKQDLDSTYNEYYEKTRLEIGRIEITNNLDDARKEIEDNDFDGALTQVEEAENDLKQLAEDLKIDVPANIFDRLKRQVQDQDRDASLQTIREMENFIHQAAENSRNN